MIQYSQKQIQAIAYRIKYTCQGCPEIVSYHHIKEELAYKSPLRLFLETNSNRDDLFDNLDLPKKLIKVLDEMSSDIDDYDRRRIAMFHGMVQFPKIINPSQKKLIVDNLKAIDIHNKQDQLTYIFLCTLADRLIEDNEYKYRHMLKLISNLQEGDDEEDSLYSHFLKLINIGTKETNISTHTIEWGGSKEINGLVARKILFDFEDYDFQDKEFVGGSRFLGRTKPLSLRKEKINRVIKNLSSLSLTESIEYLS